MAALTSGPRNARRVSARLTDGSGGGEMTDWDAARNYLATVAMSRNTTLIIQWGQRMMDKTKMCGAVCYEALACACGEDGDKAPSDLAVRLAEKWEYSPKLLFDYVRVSGKWCMSPAWGCQYGLGEMCPHLLNPGAEDEEG